MWERERKREMRKAVLSRERVCVCEGEECDGYRQAGGVNSWAGGGKTNL